MEEWIHKWENFGFGVLIGFIACNLIYLVKLAASPTAIGGTTLALAAFSAVFILRKYTEIMGRS